MGSGVSSFPLLNLPNVPLKCVLQNMELFDLFGFSLISKRSKELIRSLEKKACQISVTIGPPFYITVCSCDRYYYYYFNWTFYTEELGQNMILSNEMSDFVGTYNFEDGERKSYEWKKQGFEIKDWIDHFLSIFNRPKLDELSFLGSTPFDLDSLQHAISDVKEIDIDDRYSINYIQQVIHTYPSAKQLSLYVCTSLLKDYHTIFGQELDGLKIQSSVVNDLPKWKLDDVLIMNSRSIQIDSHNLSQEDVNEFLKNWINGSNPRMEYFEINFFNINKNKDILLNGLNYQIAPSDQERVFKRPVEYYDGSRTVIVKGGYDIQREDGTTSTIIINDVRGYTLKLFVWH